MLTFARERLGLTQAELAARLGISQGKLSKLETGFLGLSDDLRKSWFMSWTNLANIFGIKGRWKPQPGFFIAKKSPPRLRKIDVSGRKLP